MNSLYLLFFSYILLLLNVLVLGLVEPPFIVGLNKVHIPILSSSSSYTAIPTTTSTQTIIHSNVSIAFIHNTLYAQDSGIILPASTFRYVLRVYSMNKALVHTIITSYSPISFDSLELSSATDSHHSGAIYTFTIQAVNVISGEYSSESLPIGPVVVFSEQTALEEEPQLIELVPCSPAIQAINSDEVNDLAMVTFDSSCGANFIISLVEEKLNNVFQVTANKSPIIIQLKDIPDGEYNVYVTNSVNGIISVPVPLVIIDDNTPLNSNIVSGHMLFELGVPEQDINYIHQFVPFYSAPENDVESLNTPSDLYYPLISSVTVIGHNQTESIVIQFNATNNDGVQSSTPSQYTLNLHCAISDRFITSFRTVNSPVYLYSIPSGTYKFTIRDDVTGLISPPTWTIAVLNPLSSLEAYAMDAASDAASSDATNVVQVLSKLFVSTKEFNQFLTSQQGKTALGLLTELANRNNGKLNLDPNELKAIIAKVPVPPPPQPQQQQTNPQQQPQSIGQDVPNAQSPGPDSSTPNPRRRQRQRRQRGHMPNTRPIPQPPAQPIIHPDPTVGGIQVIQPHPVAGSPIQPIGITGLAGPSNTNNPYINYYANYYDQARLQLSGEQPDYMNPNGILAGTGPGTFLPPIAPLQPTPFASSASPLLYPTRFEANIDDAIDADSTLNSVQPSPITTPIQLLGVVYKSELGNQMLNSNLQILEALYVEFVDEYPAKNTQNRYLLIINNDGAGGFHVTDQSPFIVTDLPTGEYTFTVKNLITNTESAISNPIQIINHANQAYQASVTEENSETIITTENAAILLQAALAGKEAEEEAILTVLNPYSEDSEEVVSLSVNGATPLILPLNSEFSLTVLFQSLQSEVIVGVAVYDYVTRELISSGSIVSLVSPNSFSSGIILVPYIRTLLYGHHYLLRSFVSDLEGNILSSRYYIVSAGPSLFYSQNYCLDFTPFLIANIPL